MVAGRHLANWGVDVQLLLGAKVERFRPVTFQQFQILREMQVPVSEGRWVGSPALFIDALLGYQIQGDPRKPMASLIKQVNQSSLPIIALDVPSGLDATTGMPYSPCIQATVTMTLALPKTGLTKEVAQHVIGKVYLADIGIPTAVVESVTGDHPPVFKTGGLIDLSEK